MGVGPREGPLEPGDIYMPRADTRTKWQIIKDAIYNPTEGTIFGHTKKRWGIVGLFYLIFYSVLAVLCAICMMGLLATIDENRPTYTLDSSIIGTNPGLGFRPTPDNIKERSLIWYSSSNATQIKRWVTLLNVFLEKYLNKTKLISAGRNQVICDYDKPPKKGKVCTVDVNSWGPCTSTLNYGYNNSSPCVFIKLNKIYDWVPEFYNDTKNLPNDMPQDLKNHIRGLDKSKLNTIWLSCMGIDPHDKEAIGELEYYPKFRGFPGYYYPYLNLPEYLSPVIAVHFKRPQRNKVISIECRAWSKNIIYKHDKGIQSGSVHLEILIDD
ncbi:PREDICTED: sodium/potassium-transporting ATPase subunit beta-2-like [Ceratosolen solmsi marchali]|uniref:Sodium/potassium-transporting ATPase subunit beta-2-like n=1 Tax=Ceratosolen solmsi marchali TaxID=326594 RepID=A0AAJ7E073_9HYME|nr:PREDICTED: sodium/potassium-transporting ATPase subunit beta-2-like [Ceratosolen solmsi marchali]